MSEQVDYLEREFAAKIVAEREARVASVMALPLGCEQGAGCWLDFARYSRPEWVWDDWSV